MIDRISDIPDMEGPMLVPATILARYDPSQIRPLAVCHRPLVGGRCRFKRILVEIVSASRSLQRAVPALLGGKVVLGQRPVLVKMV